MMSLRTIREYFPTFFLMMSVGLSLLMFALFAPLSNTLYWWLFTGLFMLVIAVVVVLAVTFIDLRNLQRDREETAVLLDNFQEVLSSRLDNNLRDEDLVHVGRYLASILRNAAQWRLWLKLPPDLMRDSRVGLSYFSVGEPVEPASWVSSAEEEAFSWWRITNAEKRNWDKRLPQHNVQMIGYMLPKGAIVAGFYCRKWPSSLRLQILTIALTQFGHFLIGLRAQVIEARRMVDSEMYGHVVSVSVHEIARELQFVLNRLKAWSGKDETEFLPPLFRSLQRAANCLEWIRQWKQVDQEFFHVTPSPMPIRTILEDLQRYMERAWPDLSLSMRGDLEARVIGDSQLSSVFQNLLSNAAEASPEYGKLVMEVVREEKFVVVYISDQGTGIPRGNEDRIFQALVTDANGKRDGRRGTGIGLFLSRRIAQALGGDVVYCGPAPSLADGQGPGSCFGVRLLPAQEGQ
jgi:signal transduction histidine kinase